MLSQKSIRNKFFLQLASTVSVLVLIFAIMSYQILKINILQVESSKLINDANLAIANTNVTSGENYQIIYLQDGPNKASFTLLRRGNASILELLYPYNRYGDYVLISRDITATMNTLDNIFISTIFIVLIASILILFYSLFFSKLLSIHLKSLALKLSSVENNPNIRLQPQNFPQELSGICTSINGLIERIFVYNCSQKELFLGIAHELKTPLAVIKAKNDVALIKPRESEYYTQVLKDGNASINQMNKIITEILKIGRSEGAAFEESTQVNLCELIKKACDNYALLGNKKNQTLQLKLPQNSLLVQIQLTLFNQILQNFIQNALKFSPENSCVRVNCSFCASDAKPASKGKSRKIARTLEATNHAAPSEKGIFVKNQMTPSENVQNPCVLMQELLPGEFLLEVTDEGCGVDESRDHFAPFKRFEKSDGIGLGLYLCKVAASIIGAQVGICNRTDGQKGATAWVKFRPKLSN